MSAKNRCKSGLWPHLQGAAVTVGNDRKRNWMATSDIVDFHGQSDIVNFAFQQEGN